MAAAQKQPGDLNENTYVVDAESAAEMARLMRQEQTITSGMGGVFPEQIDLSGVQHVLDLACGPGGWALELAYNYPDIEVVGVDISERMIAYATAQAQVQKRNNLSFRLMNILQPFDFPDHSFDLVNARFISPFMHKDRWPAFFQECKRVLQPGGIVRLTDGEMGLSNKPHFEKAAAMGIQVLSRAGMNFSPSGTYHTFIQTLPRFFRQAGLTNLGNMAHFVEFSFGTEAHESFYHDWSMVFQLLEPTVVKLQLITLEDWRDLYHKALSEMHEEDFCAAWILLTGWGSTALEGE